MSKLSKAPPPSTRTPSTRAFGSLFCVGARYLYLISFSHRPGIVFPLAFVLPSDVNTFYQYAAQYLLNIWFNLWIKMWIWLRLVNNSTNCSYLWLALLMSHFSCRPECSCTVEQKRAREGLGNRGETRALIGEGGVNIHIFLFCLTIFFWNQLLLSLISKEIRRTEHEYMNIRPPN